MNSQEPTKVFTFIDEKAFAVIHFKTRNLEKRFILKNILVFIVIMGLIACSNVSDAERIKNARTYMAEGSYGAAVIELKNAIQANPKNKDTRFLLGQAYLQLREGVNAEKELQRARQLGSKHSKTLAPLARAFILQGMYKKALNTLQQDKTKNNKHNIQILLLSGKSYLGLSDYKNAKKFYMAAQKMAPENPNPLLGQARLSLSQGKLSQAKLYLEKAKQRAPENIEIVLLAAELFSLRGQQQKAEAAFSKALKLDQEKDFTWHKFQAMTGMATAQILQNKLNAASVNISKLIKVRPRRPFVKYLQAWLAFQKQNYALANTLLLDLHQKIPGYLPGLLLLGATSYALGNYEQANIYLSDFVTKVPTNSSARKILAATQLKLNQPEKAMLTLHSNIKATDADLISMMGQATALTGNMSAHINYLRNAIDKNPDNPSLRKELAKTYIRKGDINDAIAELKFLQHKNIQDRSTELLLIYAQLREGQVDSARKLARKILQNKPSDPNLQAAMGDIDLVAGKRARARQHFHKALELQKNHSYSQLSLARMDLEDGDLLVADQWFVMVLKEGKAPITALLGRAQVAAMEGKVDRMLSFLEKARASNEKAVSPRIILARYYSSTGRVDLALELAGEIEQQYADKSIGYQLEADSYMRGKQYREAQSAFKKAIKREPSAQLEVKLAHACFLAGNEVKGLTVLKKGLKKYPTSIGLKLALATYYQLVGNAESAVKNYNTVLEQQPLNIVALNNMASLLSKRDPLKALAYAKQAHRLAPKNMPVSDTLGWILINQEHIKEGLKVLTEAVSQGNNSTVKYHLAFALVKNRKNKKARSILTQLVKSGIKFPEQTKALTLLATLQIK